MCDRRPTAASSLPRTCIIADGSPATRRDLILLAIYAKTGLVPSMVRRSSPVRLPPLVDTTFEAFASMVMARMRALMSTPCLRRGPMRHPLGGANAAQDPSPEHVRVFGLGQRHGSSHRREPQHHVEHLGLALYACYL